MFFSQVYLIKTTLSLSLLISISLGFSILRLLKINWLIKIDLYLFTVFNVSLVSVLLLDLYLSNYLSLSYLLLLDLSFLFGACNFSVLLTVSILFFAIGGVMYSYTTLGFVPMSVFPSLKILYVVVTNDFLEDMISVLDLLYPVYKKIKVNI